MTAICNAEQSRAARSSSVKGSCIPPCLVLQAGGGGGAGDEPVAAAGGGGGRRCTGAAGAAAAGRTRGARGSPPVRVQAERDPGTKLTSCKARWLVLDHLQLRVSPAMSSLIGKCESACHSLHRSGVWLTSQDVALLYRLSQPTTATGTSWPATPPSPSPAVGDGLPAASDDMASGDDSLALANVSGAAVKSAAITHSMPEEEAVSHQTDVQGFDDRADDSEDR